MQLQQLNVDTASSSATVTQLSFQQATLPKVQIAKVQQVVHGTS
jgi:membrane protein YdbS with pleckstrin-like domain